MTLEDIANLDDSPLAELEIAQTQEVVLDQTLDALNVLCADLSEAQCQMARSYLVQYFDLMPDQTIQVKGGKGGTDYSNIRDRAAVTMKYRRLLGLPSYSEEVLIALASTQRAERGHGANDPFKPASSSSTTTSAEW